MALYGRSDVVSVAVPTTSGGCGATHSRPVANGVPLDEWDLEGVCVVCAATLKKDHDPLWSATVAEIPETPDEKLAREDAEKRGERALKKSQEELNINQHALMEKLVALMERGNPDVAPAMTPEFLAQVLLASQQLQKAMSQPQPEPEPEVKEAPPLAQEFDDLLARQNGESLERLHVRTLGKMCRDRGLNDRGGKAELIARLTAGT